MPLLLFFVALFATPLIAQLSIKGPSCVVPGVIYQYEISNSNKWAATSKMKVCIDGGIVADMEQSKRKNCTDNDAPLSAVRVIWNNVSKTSITISSSAGTKTMTVSITQQLQPGVISNKEQNLLDTTHTPAMISCPAVIGGSCSPVYSYQWQQSADAIRWKDIYGATGQNLSFTDAQKQTGYYRRQVIEKGSGTIAYSDIAEVLVFPAFPGDSSVFKIDSTTSGIIRIVNSDVYSGQNNFIDWSSMWMNASKNMISKQDAILTTRKIPSINQRKSL